MRSNTRDAARRSFLGLMRGILVKANNDPKMQELQVRTLHGQLIDGVERFQQYGHCSVPLSSGDDGKAAEVILLTLSGNQSHPIIIAVDDRRHRPTDWKEGDSGTYDHQGQKMHHQAGGTRIASPDKAISHVVADNAQHRVQAGGYVIKKVQDLAFEKTFSVAQNKWFTPMFVETTPPPDDPTTA